MTIDLAGMRARLDAATEGPWRAGADLIRVHPGWRQDGPKSEMRADAFHRNGFAKTIASVGKENGDWRPIDKQVGDAAFIAHARTDMEALLDYVERLKEGLKALSDSVQADVKERDSRMTIGTIHRAEEARSLIQETTND